MMDSRRFLETVSGWPTAMTVK